MMKKIVITTLLGLSLVLTGCGSSDSEGESQLETQQMLDNGDYAAVIAKLESTASSTSDYLSLAAAYMGKAGFSLSSIIGIVASSADSDDNNTFATFIKNSKKSSNSQSLGDLSTAVEYYQNVLGNKCLDENTTLSGAESDLCLYVGLSKVTQTSVAIGYIAGDVDVLTGDNNNSDDKLTASTCAMQYAFDKNSIINTDCNISSESNVTFVQSGKTYGDINIAVNGNTFEYLISGTADPRSTILTNGLCTLDSFATRVDDTNATGYHVCPIDETNSTKETTTEEILVNALNEGVDTIGEAVSDDVKADVDQFKQDIIDARVPADSNTTITVEDIIKYLEDKN